MSFWNIHVRKDGQAVITLTEEFGVKPTQIIRPANKDLTLTDNYLEVDYKVRSYICLLIRFGILRHHHLMVSL